jgi:integrase
MKTITLLLSSQSINNNISGSVQLRDKGCPSLIFRYSKRYAPIGTFHVRFTQRGKTSSKVIGSYPTVSIKVARSAASNYLLELEKYKFTVSRQRIFVNGKDLLNWYIEFRLSDLGISVNTKRNVIHQVSHLLMPNFGAVKIEQISPMYLAENWIIPSLNEYGLSTLKGAFQCLKAAFGQAQHLGYLANNPVKEIAFSDITAGKVIPRKSKIERWTLKQLLNLIMAFSEDTKMFCILCLGYLTRNGETALATWNDFDFDKMLWHIPASNTKTGQGITHPITPKMSAFLLQYKTWQRKRLRSKFLFPRTNGYKAITPSQAAHAISRHSNSKLRLHDLRKYGSSYLRDMEVDYYVVERILNHKMTALDRTYIHTSVFKIIRGELEKWHDEITDCV